MALIEDSGTRLNLLDSLGEVSRLSLDFLETQVFVRASHNGLLCCSAKGENGHTDYYVCNPITRQHVQLPYIAVDADLVGLACDSSGRKFNVALAGHLYDKNKEANETIIGCVYDSESNTWRKHMYRLDDLYEFSYIRKDPPVFINGAFHWITEYSPIVLLVLDLSRGLLRKMRLPDKILKEQEDNTYCSLEFEGCLSVIEISDSWMVTWVLQDYDNDVWYMLDRVSLNSNRLDLSMLEIVPICQTREDMVLGIGQWMFVYQRNSGEWKPRYKIMKYGHIDPLFYSAFPFRATMLPCCQFDDQLH
ncbi:hypothetical protein SAY86_029528 [Trapa natans]|uniref:F-box protein At3g26010-like beta-propeller domain-containing protein n=1 Tax=Trapa natans TaxID=22666 RepID=A0AAN7M3G7_TRANT|nr:hypothetical protein SAY86_029528 [Trapa natans]